MSVTEVLQLPDMRDGAPSEKPHHQLTVHEAIQRVSQLVGNIQKGGKASVGYSYRGIEQVINGVAPAMHEVGLTVIGNVLEWNLAPMIGRDRWTMTTMLVEYTVRGPMGDIYMDADGNKPSVLGYGADNDDKGPGKARSYAYKTFIGELLLIPTDAALDNEATVYVEPKPPVLISQDQYQEILSVFRSIEDTDIRKTAWDEWKESLPLKPAAMQGKDYVGMHNSARRTVAAYSGSDHTSDPDGEEG